MGQEYNRQKIVQEANERQIYKKELKLEKARIRARERCKRKQEEVLLNVL